MFKALLLVLFILILLGYVFSEPVVSSTTPQEDLVSYDNKIQVENVPPPDEPTYTLEEDIVNNMKTSNSVSDSVSSPTFSPIMASGPSAYDLE